MIDDETQDPNGIVIVDYEDYPAEWSGHFEVCFIKPEGEGSRVAPFMPLLNFFPEKIAEKSLRLVKGIMDSVPDPDAEIISLFEQINWQYHLPAAVATLMSPGKAGLIQALWSAFDHGSWVMPQLGAVAYVVDAEFDANARRRISELCPVQSPAGLSSFENHLWRGPANDTQRSAKGINSLFALCARRPDMEDWCNEAASRTAVADLAAEDIDASGRIAVRWLDSVTARFASLGLAIH